MNFVAGEIKRRGWDEKSIGLEMDAYYFSARGFVELQKDLPGADFKDGNLLVSCVRIVKSDREIDFMKQAGKISEKVMQTALDIYSISCRTKLCACDLLRNVPNMLVFQS